MDVVILTCSAIQTAKLCLMHFSRSGKQQVLKSCSYFMIGVTSIIFMFTIHKFQLSNWLSSSAKR